MQGQRADVPLNSQDQPFAMTIAYESLDAKLDSPRALQNGVHLLIIREG